MIGSPNFSPVGNAYFIVSVSVSSKASATAAGVGPFRGLFFKTSASVTVVGPSGLGLEIDNAAKNLTIWIQADFVSVIATATSVYGLI